MTIPFWWICRKPAATSSRKVAALAEKRPLPAMAGAFLWLEKPAPIAQPVAMPDLLIRFARPDDATRLRIVLQSAYATYHAAIPDLPDVAGGVADDIANHRVFVAVEHEVILGLLVLAGDASPFHLVNIATVPEAKGKGVGKALIEAAERLIREQGGGIFDLATHIAIPANVALYRHLGWQETGRSGNKVYMSRWVA